MIVDFFGFNPNGLVLEYFDVLFQIRTLFLQINHLNRVLLIGSYTCLCAVVIGESVIISNNYEVDVEFLLQKVNYDYLDPFTVYVGNLT